MVGWLVGWYDGTLLRWYVDTSQIGRDVGVKESFLSQFSQLYYKKKI